MADNQKPDIWSDDLLNRKSEARFVQNFIVNRVQEREQEKRSRSYVLNIDGSWGQGKSFFLERLSKQLASEDHLSVYINAWKDDHADDPMIAVMAAVDEALKGYLDKQPLLARAWEITKNKGMRIAISAIKSGGKKLASKLVDDGLEEITEIVAENGAIAKASKDVDVDKISEAVDQSVEKFIDVRAEKAIKAFQDTKITIETFRSSLSDFIKKFSNDTKFKIPLFILIDELDRCRPPYAISTLERIKHFFDVDGVVFLIATDSTQLKHSIKAVYGQDFDSNRYLLRFFDRSYRFLEPSHKNFVSYLFKSKPLREDKFHTPFITLEELFLRMVSGGELDLSLRDISQCYDYLRTISSVWEKGTSMHSICILHLIIFYQQGLFEEYRSAAKGSLTSSIKSKFNHVGTLLKKRNNDPYGAGGGHPDVDFNDVAGEIYHLFNITLDNIMRIQPSHNWKYDIMQQFNNEFQILYNNTTRTGTTGPTSVISEYYKYIESAGRLEALPEAG